MKVYFSDNFGVSRAVVEGYGAFDVSLVADLPLFVDPFLIFNSTKDDYQALHASIVRYLKFLKEKSAEKKLPQGLVDALFRFPEIKQNWLGFSASGNSGRGLGRKFAQALNLNLTDVFTNFGGEKISKSAHLEKLCLISDGVGRDMISDFTNNLIHGYLARYTEQFAEQFIEPHRLKRVAIRRIEFNYTTESWVTSVFNLPWHEGDYVLLTPRDMLTKDNTWINKSDLLQDFESIPDSIPNAQLRSQVNDYFRRLLGEDPTKEERIAAAKQTIVKFPQVVDYYIRAKEDDGAEAERSSGQKVRLSTQLYVDQFKQLIDTLERKTAFYDLAGDTYDEAMQRLLFLQDVIENKGGHRLFYVDGKPVQREEDLQIAYRMTWFAPRSDVSREVNDGRGPADFKISRGATDKTIVEFKLASNSQLRRNLQNQTEVYKKASDAKRSITAIMYFSEGELERVRRILRDLKLDSAENIVLIDARNDNKPSGSKAKS